MNLDLGSFAYGGIVLSGGNTPSWGTSLGQSQPDYKFTYPGADNILIGMMYCAIPLQCVSLPLGKGGRTYTASETSECQLASLFKKVYINETRIDYPFLMVLIREESASHTGRRTIKYSDKIAYNDGINQCNNEEFVKHTRVRLGLAENACWFVYSLEIKNQDELHMYAVIVDANNSVDYPDSQTRRKIWLELLDEDVKIFHKTSNHVFGDEYALQKIYYGSPGTGKSHRIKKIITEHGIDEKEHVIRTTFHPDSDYSTFVGCYKPIMKSVPQTYVVEGNEKPVMADKDNQATREEIVYDYTPQAFVQAYTKAWTTDKQVILVIEEINRGNCAQIFGDIFQLLDRGEDGVSEYEIKPDKALENYLNGYFAKFNDVEIPAQVRCGEIMKLPSNLYLWATMNTSDQSLFPIDSAFKRRWEWKYVPINNYKDKSYSISIGDVKYDWWGFLIRINRVISEVTNSEDKKLGYFFAKAKDSVISAEQFVGKVLFYLWNDVFKNYGFDSPIFSKGGNLKFEFSDFFDNDGNPNTETVNQFLRKLEEIIKDDLQMEIKPGVTKNEE